MPPAPEEKEVRATLASIGIGPGKTFDFKKLSPEQKDAFMLGMKAGDEKVEKFLASGMKMLTTGALVPFLVTVLSSAAIG